MSTPRASEIYVFHFKALTQEEARGIIRRSAMGVAVNLLTCLPVRSTGWVGWTESGWAEQQAVSVLPPGRMPVGNSYQAHFKFRHNKAIYNVNWKFGQ